jgi:hypothetical protein
MIYAICSSPRCEFAIALHDHENGRSIETPERCPACKSEIISLCPHCGFLLVGALGSTVCQVCKADVRESFGRHHAGVQKSSAPFPI